MFFLGHLKRYLSIFCHAGHCRDYEDQRHNLEPSLHIQFMGNILGLYRDNGKEDGNYYIRP